MRRMTCRNGFVFGATICIGLMAAAARAGTNNFMVSPYSPTNPASAMFTLNDIYNKLDTRADVSTRTNAFTEPSGEPASGTMHTLDDIMALATNRAAVPKTGQTNSYAPYDDGWYGSNVVGVAWPNPRFTTNNIDDAGTNVVTDNLTGLMWTRNANRPNATLDWTNAINYCTNMNDGVGTYGYADWRLPNRKELFSLIDARWGSPPLCNTEGNGQWTEGHPFSNVHSASYWTSTAIITMMSRAWYVSLSDGGSYYSERTSTLYVWPVRGGQ